MNRGSVCSLGGNLSLCYGCGRFSLVAPVCVNFDFLTCSFILTPWRNKKWVSCCDCFMLPDAWSDHGIAGMSDATKRRKNDPEEFSSESEWDDTVGQSSGSPAIDNQARYVTEGETVVAKPMKKEKGGKTSAVPVRAPDTSHVRHVDKSFAVPPGPADFKVWSQTVVVMDKFADMDWSFSELLAAGEKDAKIARYISWIVGTYATPAVANPQNQAEDFGLFARACGWKPKTKGYQRKTK